MKLFSSTGEAVSLTGLEEPLEPTLPVNNTPGMECIYWDEYGGTWWRNEGLHTLEGDGLMVCSTTHLTVVAGIYNGIKIAILCSQATLLPKESYLELVQSEWYSGMGAFLIWMSLALFSELLDNLGQGSTGVQGVPVEVDYSPVSIFITQTLFEDEVADAVVLVTVFQPAPPSTSRYQNPMHFRRR